METVFGKYKIVRCIAKKNYKLTYLAQADDTSFIVHCFPTKQQQQMLPEWQTVLSWKNSFVVPVEHIVCQQNNIIVVRRFSPGVPLNKWMQQKPSSAPQVLQLAKK